MEVKHEKILLSTHGTEFTVCDRIGARERRPSRGDPRPRRLLRVLDHAAVAGASARSTRPRVLGLHVQTGRASFRCLSPSDGGMWQS
jgi:hypothetical protein